MAKEVSVSLSYGEGTAEAHDRRDYTPNNAERSLSHRNVTIIACPDMAQAVNDFYGPAIRRYNDKQSRDDRKKSEDYYQALLDGSEGYGTGKTQERPVLEYVIQLGNKDDNGVTDASFDPEHWQKLKKAGKYDEAADYVQQHLNADPDREQLKQILIDRVAAMPAEYPNLHFIAAEYHDDEPGGTGHVHIKFSPFVTDCKRGLDTRVSLRGAMQAMFPYAKGGEAALDEWKIDVKDKLTEALQAQGYDRKFMSNEEKRLSTSNFKRMKQAEALDRKIAEQTDRLSDLQAEVARVRVAKMQAEAAARKAEAAAQAAEGRQRAAEAAVRDAGEAMANYRAELQKPSEGLTGPSDAAIIELTKRKRSKATGRTLYETLSDDVQREQQQRQAAAKQQAERKVLSAVEFQRRMNGTRKQLNELDYGTSDRSDSKEI